MKYIVFKIIVILENILKIDPKMSDWMEYKYYRKARRGYWGRYDMGHNLLIWYPTCEHFTPPVFGIRLLDKESY